MNGNPLVVTLPESTVTVALPALAINVAGTVAVSCVALPNVVVSAVVFRAHHSARHKVSPVHHERESRAPAVAEVGLMEVIVGGGALIVNGNPLVVTLPESTVIVALPALPINIAGTVAVS